LLALFIWSSEFLYFEESSGQLAAGRAHHLGLCLHRHSARRIRDRAFPHREVYLEPGPVLDAGAAVYGVFRRMRATLGSHQSYCEEVRRTFRSNCLWQCSGVIASNGRKLVDPGIVHQDVELSVSLLCIRKKFRDVGRLRDIALRRNRLSALGRNPLSHRIRAGLDVGISIA
jgi:hypothetical protein